MPLTAVLDGQRVDSVLSSDDEWLELKKTYKSRSLLMSCGLPAFPRNSNQGLRHFVHKGDAKCSVLECWSETPQHRAGKAIVARAVADAGWVATIEHQADDRSWTADVLAEKDGRRIAFEIQWSKQGSPEFAARQERYEKAGVECFWFVHRRNKATAEEAGVPHLPFEGDGIPLDVLAHRAFQANESTSLSDVTKLILTGGFLDRAETKATAVTVEYLEMECFACHRDSTIWRIQAVDVRTRCQQASFFERSSYGSSWPQERLETAICEEMASASAWPSPLAPLRMHYSNPTCSTYLAYGCAHCKRGFFGDYFIGECYDWDEVVLPVRTRIPLSERMLQDAHICEDNGFGRCSQQPREHVGPAFSGYTSIRPDDDENIDEDPYDDDDEDTDQSDGDFSLKVVGRDMSIKEAALRMTGLWNPPASFQKVEPASSQGSVSALEKDPLVERLPTNTREVPAGECDLCGIDDHPACTCLWRRYRTLVKARVRRPHFTDDIYFRIKEGLLEEAKGTELLRRLMDRVLANKATHGNTGSVAELLHDMDGRRP